MASVMMLAKMSRMTTVPKSGWLVIRIAMRRGQL